MNRRAEAVLDALEEPLVTCDGALRVYGAPNRAFRETFGAHGPGDDLGRTVLAPWGADQRAGLGEVLARLLTAPEPTSGGAWSSSPDLILVDPDGAGARTFSLSVCRVSPPESPVLALLKFTDVTADRRLRDETDRQRRLQDERLDRIRRLLARDRTEVRQFLREFQALEDQAARVLRGWAVADLVGSDDASLAVRAQTLADLCTRWDFPGPASRCRHLADSVRAVVRLGLDFERQLQAAGDYEALVAERHRWEEFGGRWSSPEPGNDRTFADLARLLRPSLERTSRNVGKPLDLSFVGADSPVDPALFQALGPALAALGANAVVHGVELPEVRAALGKSPHGRVEIAYQVTGARWTIRVKDDGQGLDFARLRGQVSPDGPDLAPHEVIRAVVSGRLGTGFQTVRQLLVADLGARITIRSRLGQGTAVELEGERVSRSEVYSSVAEA